MMHKITQVILVASLLVLPTFGAVLPTQKLAARSEADVVSLDAREPSMAGSDKFINLMRNRLRAARRNIVPFALQRARARLQSVPSARRAQAFLANVRSRLPPTGNMYRRLQAVAARAGRARGLRPRDLEDIDGLYAREMDDELEARSFDDLEDLYIRSLYDAIDDLEARSLSEFEELEARELEYGLDELD